MNTGPLVDARLPHDTAKLLSQLPQLVLMFAWVTWLCTWRICRCWDSVSWSLHPHPHEEGPENDKHHPTDEELQHCMAQNLCGGERRESTGVMGFAEL